VRRDTQCAFTKKVSPRCCFFVFLFVVIKPENTYFASRPGSKSNPLGVYPLGPRGGGFLLGPYLYLRSKRRLIWMKLNQWRTWDALFFLKARVWLNFNYSRLLQKWRRWNTFKLWIHWESHVCPPNEDQVHRVRRLWNTVLSKTAIKTERLRAQISLKLAKIKEVRVSSSWPGYRRLQENHIFEEPLRRKGKEIREIAANREVGVRML